MAKSIRPRALAAGFGLYFLLIAFVAWGYAQSLPSAWYGADLTRWVYTTYMVVSAIFLVGLGGLGFAVRGSFLKQLRELDRRFGSGHDARAEALPPPLPETAGTRDHVDRDIDELLESLSEIEATSAQEAAAMEARAGEAVRGEGHGAFDSAAAAHRERLLQRSKYLGRFVIGPGVVAAFILGISGIMLPGADGFAQYNFALNTAIILGIAFSWLGLGGYVAATVLALSSVAERRSA